MSLFNTQHATLVTNLEKLLAVLQTKIYLTPARLLQILNFYSSDTSTFAKKLHKENLDSFQENFWQKAEKEKFTQFCKKNLLDYKVETIQQILGYALQENLASFKAHFPHLRWLKKLSFSLDSLEMELANLELSLSKQAISLVSFWQDDYPQMLLQMENYPLVLYYQGNIRLANSTELITVVGSRNYSNYGRFLLETILRPVCQLGIGVVSGLAIGIDSLAHRTALVTQAKTIGVIGSGLANQVFYPRQNLSLKEQILADGGLVLSEFAPETSANIYTFPQRNRLLAGLTELTWVAQAGIDSGSLITALKARDLGRTVASTPGDIRDQSIAGNLKLLKDGAHLVSDSQDLLQLLGLKLHPQIQSQPTPQFSNATEEQVYRLLSFQPQNIEEITEKSGLSLVEIQNHLTMLELSGLARQIGENNWVKDR